LVFPRLLELAADVSIANVLDDDEVDGDVVGDDCANSFTPGNPAKI
jgi:hypothetical protein